LGTEGVYELVRHPANGLTAVARVLEGFQPDRTLEQFIGEWAAANLLDDFAYGKQFAYESLTLKRPSLQTRVRSLPFSDFLELEQLAVHYIDLDTSGPLQLSFAGDTTAKLIDAPPTSGEQMWYAPPENDTHAQLTAAFDLSGVEQATLEFDAWYDLEADYDFAYVTASSDGGTTWRVLYPEVWPSSGHFGLGFSGSSAAADESSNGWIHEHVSLDEFGGRQVLLRFHVLTDFETVGRGFALDNIAIPEIGYMGDGESDDERWQAEGFLRTGWLLPQRWSVQIVSHTAREITELQLDASNQAQITIELGEEGGTLIVIPLTPFAEETAAYWINATLP
jgi:hypothetical protein